MRKCLILFFTIIILGTISVNAFACPDCPAYQMTDITEGEARMIIHQHLSLHFRGFRVNEITHERNPKGISYYVEAVNASGNVLLFTILPNGNVIGPTNRR
jgi:hypothetical protein